MLSGFNRCFMVGVKASKTYIHNLVADALHKSEKFIFI